MTDTITTTGVVATEPEGHVTDKGLQIANFRLAAGQRKYDKATGQWQDNGTNWYTVKAFRRLAGNLTGSLAKGDRVVVTGRQRMREWEKDGITRQSIEIEADAIGHDLNWGTSAFTRTKASSGASGSSEGGDRGDGDGFLPADSTREWATAAVPS